MEKITAIVLAAGKGIRMKSAQPKMVHKLCGKEMINITIGNLKRAGFKSIICVLGFKKEAIEEILPKGIKKVSQGSQLGTADAVLKAKKILDSEDILILYGDHPLMHLESLKEVVNTHKKEKADLTLLTANLKAPREFGRVLRDDQGQIMEIKEFLELNSEEKKIKEVNPGLLCFKRKSLYPDLEKVKINKKNKEYFLTEIIKIFYKGNRKIVEVKSKFPEEDGLGINTFRDLIEAEKILRQRIINEFIDKGVKIIDPHLTFIDGEVKIGKNTVIFPFTFIEKDVIIGDNCSLGPFIRLRGGTRIKDNTHLGNFLEISRSKIGRGVRAKHLGYIGDTTVGDNVNIGAGTVVANYDGKRKHKTFIGKDAFIGCDTVIVAPVKVGKGALTGAGSVVNKDVKPKTVVVGVPAKFLKKISTSASGRKNRKG